jgi:hypothetical protein
MSRAFACRIPLFGTFLFGLLFLETCSGQITDLSGNPADPLSDQGKVRVLLFVRTDCPITNRYAPELRRIADHFAQSPVAFFLVYSGRAESGPVVEKHIREYRFPGTVILDPGHDLARRAHATVAPEAAIFDHAGRLVYHGRIDDRWISFGTSRPQPTVHDLESAVTAALAGKPPREQTTQAIGCALEDVR